MKIKYTNNGQGRMPAYVFFQDQTHEVTPGQELDLKVQRGDDVRYRVGKFAATHKIDFQSPDATFMIQPNKKLQLLFVAALLILVGVLFVFQKIDNLWLTIIVVIALIGYEALNYFTGYQAVPWHPGERK
ncbi:hypothetical protein [Lacticaseibacillus daqingensis]|uniref:hypothetical protein n=1 Tax=Lacticaseibacillus daqingensis TaxID=2486014 RepID=UPI000F792581|nr:hypothetical protein [Lacticaseibacillus daqingensis]